MRMIFEGQLNDVFHKVTEYEGKSYSYIMLEFKNPEASSENNRYEYVKVTPEVAEKLGISDYNKFKEDHQGLTLSLSVTEYNPNLRLDSILKVK